jgi:hypothetical protein
VIEAGRAVIVLIGGANRDPEVFEQPGEFRIDRPDPGRHLSFSLGIHHCLGASLARLEGRIAIEGRHVHINIGPERLRQQFGTSVGLTVVIRVLRVTGDTR